MINVGLYYRVKLGHEKEFEAIFSRVVEGLKKSTSGMRNAKLYKSIGEDNEYMIYTEWDSVESFRKFISSNEFRSTTREGSSIIEGIPKHRIFREESG
ncbi:MAG: antibiotic biosynthesis monooxygenase [Candidatus Micrarchaeaceae archaeon]